jgi:hypothetical protein
VEANPQVLHHGIVLDVQFEEHRSYCTVRRYRTQSGSKYA